MRERQRKMENNAIHSKIEYSDLRLNIFGWWSTSLAWFAYARIFSTFFYRVPIEISETRIIGFFPLHARPASKQANNVWRANERYEEKNL